MFPVVTPELVKVLDFFTRNRFGIFPKFVEQPLESLVIRSFRSNGIVLEFIVRAIAARRARDAECAFFSKVDEQEHVQVLDMADFDLGILQEIPKCAPVRFVEDIRQKPDFSSFLNSANFQRIGIVGVVVI